MGAGCRRQQWQCFPSQEVLFVSGSHQMHRDSWTEDITWGRSLHILHFRVWSLESGIWDDCWNGKSWGLCSREVITPCAGDWKGITSEFQWLKCGVHVWGTFLITWASCLSLLSLIHCLLCPYLTLLNPRLSSHDPLSLSVTLPFPLNLFSPSFTPFSVFPLSFWKSGLPLFLSKINTAP